MPQIVFWVDWSSNLTLFHALTTWLCIEEKNLAILLYFAGSSADWLKYITGSDKVGALEVRGMTKK